MARQGKAVLSQSLDDSTCKASWMRTKLHPKYEVLCKPVRAPVQYVAWIRGCRDSLVTGAAIRSCDQPLDPRV